jgi:hypothetical protein
MLMHIMICDEQSLCVTTRTYREHVRSKAERLGSFRQNDREHTQRDLIELAEVHWIPPTPKSNRPSWFRFKLRWVFYLMSLVVLAVVCFLQLEPILKRLREDEWYLYSVIGFAMGTLTGIMAALLIQITIVAMDPKRELSSDQTGRTALLLTPASIVFWFVFMAATTTRQGTHLAIALSLLCVLPVVFIVWKSNTE